MWHNFKEYFPKTDLKCERCGGTISIKPIKKTGRDICRLGVEYAINKGWQAHYTKGGVLWKENIL